MVAPTGWRYWKQHVRIPQLLESAGHTEQLRLVGKRLWGPCPVHRGDNPHAFQVDLERDLWFCFTQCARGGDVIDLARLLSAGCWRRAARWLEQLSHLEPTGCCRAQEDSGIPAAVSPDFRPFRRALRLDCTHLFFRNLGLTPTTVRRFEAGAWYGPGFLEATVAVRVHDAQGRPLGYAGRRLDRAAIERWGKWKWPPKLPKTHILWNWHRLRPDAAKGLIVVESPWSVMKLAQAGFDNAVALCGLAISSVQLQMLLRARKILLFLDGDEAGIHASARHAASKFHPCIRVIHPPANLDPADLSEAQLIELLTRQTR
ncbi:MAG: toprim domain-containing protein [Acidobacteria bacterium]|nr:toprim domain-containing protein [Acidobacteriota bacterium]